MIDDRVMFAKKAVEYAEPTKTISLPYQYGRVDNTACQGGAGRLPGAQGGMGVINKVFVERMGLTLSDAVTLMGAHSLGHVNVVGHHRSSSLVITHHHSSVMTHHSSLTHPSPVATHPLTPLTSTTPTTPTHLPLSPPLTPFTPGILRLRLRQRNRRRPHQRVRPHPHHLR